MGDPYGSEKTEQRYEQEWTIPTISAWGWVPLRVFRRFVASLGWTILCYLVMLCVTPVAWVAPAYGKKLRKAVAMTWHKTLPLLFGLRVTTIGRKPEEQFFLVGNHISWIDLFALPPRESTRYVAMAETASFPIIGRLMNGLEPIYVRRKREDTPRVLGEIIAALERGEDVQMAPEAVISPGRQVKWFHAALLEAAVQTRTPVHYCSITYRTPKGSQPPSETMIYGPDPYYRSPKGKLSPEELAAWGPKRSFLTHLIILLALPYQEIVVRFGRDPIWRDDRITLANDLQKAIQDIFTPIH
ncbi:MAG: hypothetical protein GWP08_00060 [Nitrospiraceae bacterium]|nr:hypothetical protein [Nitrospiraceae bacterium]